MAVVPFLLITCNRVSQFQCSFLLSSFYSFIAIIIISSNSIFLKQSVLVPFKWILLNLEHICVCVCTYVYVYVYMCMYIYVCVCVYMYVRPRIFILF